MLQIAAIFGISGGLRTCELVDITMEYIQDRGNYLRVDIPKSKNLEPKYFMIDGLFYDTVKTYLNLRPDPCKTDRFLLNFQNGKCTNQPIGKNKAGKFPRAIAEFLGLPNPGRFTGHCFRRTSATILANTGCSIEDIKRHGNWKSTSVAEGYIAESEEHKRRTGKTIAGAIAGPSGQSEANVNDVPKLRFSISICKCSNYHINLAE